MEEKKRYKWSQDAIEECAYEDYDYIVDTETNMIFDDDNYFKLVNILNQQDKRIKELEKQEETYAKFSSYQFEENKLRYNNLYKDLTEQCQQLTQQLVITGKALELACETLQDINFKLYNTEMNFDDYFKQQAKEMLENE